MCKHLLAELCDRSFEEHIIILEDIRLVNLTMKQRRPICLALYSIVSTRTLVSVCPAKRSLMLTKGDIILESSDR